MGALTIGRVGLDLDLNHPSEWKESRGLEERAMTVTGFLKSTSVVNTKIIRSELLEMQGNVVAVTYSNDSHFDGYYVLGDVRVETMATSYNYKGLFPYEIGLFRIGSVSRTELISNTTGTVLTNDHGLLATQVTPFIAPPVGHLAFNWEAAGITEFTRPNEDGAITVYTSDGDFSEDADWGCAPADYYRGACDLFVASRLRSGLDIPNQPGDWQMENGILRVTSESGNTGRIEVEIYDGATWQSLRDIAFDRGGKLSGFDYFTITRNDPEAVIIRLRGGETSQSTDTVDLQIRRGAPFLLGIWNYTGAATSLKVVDDAGIAATAVTPSGTDVGVHSSDDGSGNALFILTPQTHTPDITNCGVTVATTQQIRFAIGWELDGTLAAANDTAEKQALQYFGYLAERVRAVWR